jgi:diguanylate cyclase (GGDEF)-like protein
VTGDVLVPVLITFLIVSVILLVGAGAKGQLRRRGAAAAGRPPELEVADGPAAPDPTDPTDPTEAQPARARVGLDMLTGLDDEATWDRRVADESARVRRYPRPVTIVRLELDGLERLTGLLGEEAGDRLLLAMADTLRRLARDTDHVARLGHGGFGVLMPETQEEAAVGYVERVSRACGLWLETGAIAVRLAIGWAATSGGIDLAEVQQLATERMHGGQWRDTRRAGTIAGEAPAASGARRPPVTDVPSVTGDVERPPVTYVSSETTPSLDWDRCRDPGCDHKKDHRRDRQR